MVAMKVREIMSTDLVTVGLDASVRDVSRLMIDRGIGGVPVVDENGGLAGIITEEDLIMRDVRIHFPTYIQLLDAVIYLGSVRRYENELRKALGATARDVMTSDPVTIEPDADVEEAATLMVEKGISRLPVVSEGTLVGIITKRDIVRSLAESG